MRRAENVKVTPGIKFDWFLQFDAELYHVWVIVTIVYFTTVCKQEHFGDLKNCRDDPKGT